MKKSLFILGLIVSSFTSIAQWNTTNNGTVAETQLDVKLTNPNSRHFSITNTNSSSDPVRLFLSGNSYGRGLQLGRNDGNHKIFITGDIEAYKSLRFYNTGGRYFSITNTNSTTEPAKLFLSGNSYGRGLQIGRDDGNHKIILTGNVGIGTTNPVRDLHLKKSNPGGQVRFQIENSDNSSSTSHGVMSIYSGGSNSGDAFLHLHPGNGSGEWSIGVDNSNDDKFKIGSNFFVGSATALTIDHSLNVGIGTTDPLSKLSVKGNIRATEVKVLADISVPDYVFESDYELRTLKETKEYITNNKHLPDIPSASEIGENGIDLGDMNMRLLKKIEELTLYQIELLERLEKAEQEISQLKNK